MRTCSVDACERPHIAQGLCSSHYSKARRAGTLSPAPTLAERWESKVDKSGECWLWTGYTDSNGYSQMHRDGRAVGAHRVAWELHVGPIPDGLVIDHLCRTPSCVNPAHLEPVPQRVNVLRGESPAAKQARQTECHRGHPFDEQNTIVNRHGKRRCRTCFNQNRRVSANA